MHVPEERFDSLEAKMIGIEEALARTSSCAEINRVKPNRFSHVETNIYLTLFHTQVNGVDTV